MHPTLIYILGAGNSGSTLLSMVLGAHSRIASIGEIVQLDRWYSNGGLCSCGATLSNCDMWGPILENEYRKAHIPVAPVPKRAHFFVSNSSRLRKDPHLAETIQRNIELYDKVLRNQKVDTLVDSSKDPLHFYYLHRSGYFKIIPVLLVRRGDDYMESALRRGSSRVSAVLRWLKLNVSAKKVLNELRLRETVVNVKFKNLVRDPENALKAICKKAGLEYEPQMLEFYKLPHHNIAGTRTRFNPRPIEDVGPKGKNLSALDRAIFRVSGGIMWNKRFGA